MATAVYTPDQYVAVLKRRANSWKDASQVVDTIRDDLRKDVYELLTGPLTREQERRMGYPYGRNPTLGKRRGGQRQIRRFKRGRTQPTYHGYMPRLPINRQQGNLLRAARISTRRTDDGYEVRLWFTPTKALWTLVPGGTEHQVARGFWREINKRMLYRKAGIIKRTRMAFQRK